MDKQWRDNAKDTLKSLRNLDPNKATRDQFILLGASLAILAHLDQQGETIHPEIKHAAQGENEGLDGMLLDYMADELADSEKYIKLWQQTGNADFKGIACDELHHFDLLAKYTRTIEPNIGLNPHMVQHKALADKLI